MQFLPAAFIPTVIYGALRIKCGKGTPPVRDVCVYKMGKECESFATSVQVNRERGLLWFINGYGAREQWEGGRRGKWGEGEKQAAF